MSRVPALNEPDSPLDRSRSGIAANLQYDLFSVFHGDERALSNTVEFWDAIPKYAVSARKQAALRQSARPLALYKQEFCWEPQPRKPYNTHRLSLVLAPATIEEEDGSVAQIFPSADEELIEEVLRKLFCDHSFGEHDTETKTSRVRFTLGMIHRELAARNKTRSYAEILRSLKIMNGCNVEVKPLEGGKAIMRSPILPSLVGVSRKDWLADPASRFSATFAEPLYLAVQNLAFRQFNYQLLMSLKHPLARWIFKRLSHEYVNAAYDVPYNTLLSTVIRDSGMLADARSSRNITALNQALTELSERKVLLIVKSTPIGTGRTPDDVAYVLTPGPDFIAQVKAANSRNNAILDRAFGQRLVTPAVEARQQRLKQRQDGRLGATAREHDRARSQSAADNVQV